MDNIEQWDTSSPRMRELLLRFAQAQRSRNHRDMEILSEQMRQEQERITTQKPGPPS